MYKSLIVDDEKPVWVAIRKLGHWNQYQISQPHTAANGKDGLCAMRELRPEIVFVDMEMPIMSGGAFLEQASAEFPESQFIIISGYDEFSYAQHALRYGACDYLLKPIVEKELNRAIEKAVLKINPHAVFDGQEETVSESAITPEKAVEIIKQYVDNHYCQNFKITMFEEKYFFSTAYLSKLFHSRYGYSIYEYALKLRMERAQELLKNTDIKIQDIAERLGYSDNHYFSKAYRNYYGISPSQSRKTPEQ